MGIFIILIRRTIRTRDSSRVQLSQRFSGKGVSFNLEDVFFNAQTVLLISKINVIASFVLKSN